MIFVNYEKIYNIKLKDYNCLKETYPEITVSYLPQEILIMLKRIYTGNKSELTAIMQYTYQYYVLLRDPKFTSISNALEQIIRCKMNHYGILARLLVKCGIDPKNCIYIDSNPNLCDYWKASSVSYEKSLVKMFENNVLLQQRIIDEYEQIIKKTDNENLKEIIAKMIDEEQLNLIYFTSILSELKK